MISAAALSCQQSAGQQRRPPDLARLERSLTGVDSMALSGSCSTSSSGSSSISGSEEGSAEPMPMPTARADSLFGVDARSRFSASKALFERMERQSAQQPPVAAACPALPCFYSPRLQRSNSAGFGPSAIPKPPPPVPPPKPANSQSVTPSASFTGSSNITAEKSAVNSKCPVPGSPLTQLARNFSQFATDVERIASEPRSAGTGTGHPVASYGGAEVGEATRKTSLSSEQSATTVGSNNTQQQQQTTQNNEPKSRNGAQQPSGYDAYWRRPAYYRDRLFGSIERAATREERHFAEKDPQSPSSPPGGSESGEDSVPSEPRPSSASPAKKDGGMAAKGAAIGVGTPFPPVETMRGLSPERDPVTGRKISFSTAPIRVYKTHGVEEYDRRNDDIDPVASCAEYELERRLERMELFEVELEKGPEGLGVSIIGMGVGADAGLEKLGIFVKSITPGGAVHRDGRIRQCDQIVSVDGVSLVGVTQIFAAQTLRSTGSRVLFTIGRERDLEGSEVAQLIRQSLEQDRLRERQQTIGQQLGRLWGDAGEEASSGDSLAEDTAANPNPAHEVPPGKVQSNGTVADPTPASAIRSRIQLLETELEQSQRKAQEMDAQLENTRAHYAQLESRYNQARDILKTFQEREREMLRREETHVEQLRTKEREYADLVGGLRARIEELEGRLDAMAKERTQLEQGELSELRVRLEQCGAQQPQAKVNRANGEALKQRPGQSHQQQAEQQQQQQHTAAQMLQSPPPRENGMPPPTPAHRNAQQQQQPRRSGELAVAPAQPQMAFANQQRHFRPIGLRHAGLAAHTVPLSAAQPPMPLFQSPADLHRPFIIQMAGSRPPAEEMPLSAGCPQSPVPRVSEPASPALPAKWAKQAAISHGAHHHQHGRLGLFPLRRHFVPPAENEFWRENQEAQGLAVLQWGVDEVCQLLIHLGLEKFIPEFTVNQITGPKLLELDGSKLKAMGLFNHSERAVIKKRVKAIKQRIERERKALEKEAKQRAALKIVSIQ